MRTSILSACVVLLALAPGVGAQAPKERLILKGDTEPTRAPYAFESMLFSHDGKTIATFGQGMKLWDATTGEIKKTLKPHTPAVYSMAFSPDDQLIALNVG